MAFLVIGSPMIVQLHWSGPTGKVSRMSAEPGTVMEKSWKNSQQRSEPDKPGFYRR
jgi:hypothetical protein